ncbi:MAG: hypothetical protein ACI923_000376 [Flavobacteriales bacterium]|jgi:hypothetical protein
MKNITLYTDEQLRRVGGMWLVKSTELNWKANKLKARLQKRLEREAKRHASLEPTHKLLSTAKIVLQALLPHGESKAVELVRVQITECEAKIHDVTYRYNLLSDEEIALKYMDLELAEMKMAMARTAMVEAEAELASRIVVMELVEAIEAAAPISERTTVLTARLPGTSKKAELELSILKTLRQSPNGFKRLRGYRNAAKNVNLVRLKSGFSRAGGMLGIGRLKVG